MRGNTELREQMIFKARWLQHLLFWTAILAFLLTIFSSSSPEWLNPVDGLFTLVFSLPLALAVYVNLYLLIPRLLGKGRYLLYSLCLGLLTLCGAFLLYFLFDRWIDYLLPGYYFISYYSVGENMLFMGAVLALATLLKLSRSWFLLHQVEKSQVSQQLKVLQNQINPHFLLNSMQTIYALSLNQDKHTPEVILKLGDILKYTLYETEHAAIALEDEWKLIADYIDMYRYRVESKRVDIALECIGEPGRLKIAPMLLIPFIENCFKHGLEGPQEKASIRIALKVQGSKLDFSAVNSTGKAGAPDASPAPERRKGIGIENTQQRLELLYPGKHRLEIREEGGEYSVNLRIQLDD